MAPIQQMACVYVHVNVEIHMENMAVVRCFTIFSECALRNRDDVVHLPYFFFSPVIAHCVLICSLTLWPFHCVPSSLPLTHISLIFFLYTVIFFLSRSISLRWTMVFVRTRNINGVIFTLPGISSRHFQVFFTLNRGTPNAKLVFPSLLEKKAETDRVNLTPFKFCMCAPFLLCTI